MAILLMPLIPSKKVGIMQQSEQIKRYLARHWREYARDVSQGAKNAEIARIAAVIIAQILSTLVEFENKYCLK